MLCIYEKWLLCMENVYVGESIKSDRYSVIVIFKYIWIRIWVFEKWRKYENWGRFYGVVFGFGMFGFSSLGS